MQADQGWAIQLQSADAVIFMLPPVLVPVADAQPVVRTRCGPSLTDPRSTRRAGCLNLRCEDPKSHHHAGHFSLFLHPPILGLPSHSCIRPPGPTPATNLTLGPNRCSFWAITSCSWSLGVAEWSLGELATLGRWLDALSGISWPGGPPRGYRDSS